MELTKLSSRSISLDTLRGLAILMMVLSGTIPFDGSLPAWMYHVQVPPPDHVFNPTLPGISWVDLVFPFFLFSMGAAIPFSLSVRIFQKTSVLKIIPDLIWRWAGLVLFAFFIFNMRPWIIKEDGIFKWAISLTGFVFLIMAYLKVPSKYSDYEKHIHIMGYIALIFIVGLLQFTHKIFFDISHFDIILMVLACVSLAGSLIWLVCRDSSKMLAIIWVLVASFYIGAKFQNSWETKLWDFSPASWLISWNYLKYLLIIIPGLWTGNVLRSYNTADTFSEDKKLYSWIIAGTLILVNVVLTIGLFSRELIVVVITLIGCFLLLYFCLRKWNSNKKILVKKLIVAGSVFLFTGMLLEPVQGGIKKDPATLSYFVITSGMAIYMLTAFIIIIESKGFYKSFSLLTGSGKNAMLAYFIGSNLIIPVMVLTGIDSLFNIPAAYTFWQTAKAVIITLLVAWTSQFMAKKKITIRA